MNAQPTHTPRSPEQAPALTSEQPACTSAQVDALLRQPGTTAPEFVQHPELAALRSVFADLRSASSAAAAQRRPALRHPRAGRFGPVFSAGWGALAAAALVCAVAVPLALHHRRPVAVQAGLPVAAAAGPAAAALAQPAATVSDEALLADVQADLNDSVPSAMLPLSTDSSSTESTSTTQRNRP